MDGASKALRSAIPQRVAYWDNLKGVLIVLVVLGHYLWEYRGYGGVREATYAIYLFHMPAFIFVSGYFSRSGHSTSAETLGKLLIWFLLLNFSMMFYARFVHAQPFSLLDLYYSSWYLLALFLYRLTLPLCSRVPFIVPISVGVSLAVGFAWRIDHVLELQKIVALYPFFIVGAKLPAARMEGFVAWLKRHPWAVAGGSLAVALLSAWLVLHGTFGQHEALWLSYRTDVGAAIRLLGIVLAGAIIVILLALTPRGHLPFINRWGRNSLAIYVAHRIFTLLLALHFPLLASEPGGCLWLAIACFLTLLVLGADRVAGPVNRGLEFVARPLARLVSAR